MLKGPGMQLPKSPLDIRLSNNNYNNINNKLKYLAWFFCFFFVCFLFWSCHTGNKRNVYAAVSLKEPFVFFLPSPGNEQDPKAPEGKGQPLTPLGKGKDSSCCGSSSWKYGADLGEDSWQCLKARWWGGGNTRDQRRSLTTKQTEDCNLPSVCSSFKARHSEAWGRGAVPP